MRRGEDTLANKFREDLYQKNFKFIGYREDLYTSLGIDVSDAELLAQGNLKYVFSCIPNMYRTGKRFKRSDRLSFYKDIICSEKVAGWLSATKNKGSLLRQFEHLYNTRCPYLMDMYYSVAMKLRNVFGNIWNRHRNNVK